jgi:hypothetical protein
VLLAWRCTRRTTCPKPGHSADWPECVRRDCVDGEDQDDGVALPHNGLNARCGRRGPLRAETSALGCPRPSARCGGALSSSAMSKQARASPGSARSSRRARRAGSTHSPTRRRAAARRTGACSSADLNSSRRLTGIGYALLMLVVTLPIARLVGAPHGGHDVARKAEEVPMQLS